MNEWNEFDHLMKWVIACALSSHSIHLLQLFYFNLMKEVKLRSERKREEAINEVKLNSLHSEIEFYLLNECG